MPKLKNGHAPGHVRDTACAAFEAWIDWDGNDPEPTVEYEIHREPHPISISRAAGLVWNCTDIVPGDLFDRLQEEAQSVVNYHDEPAIKRRTYAAVAHFIHENIKENVTRAA